MKHSIILITIIMAFAALISIGAADAADSDEGKIYSEGPLYYTIANESVTITGCFGKKEEITVPAMLAGYPVNAIAKDAFANNKYLKKLNLPDTISKVEEGAIADGIKVVYNANTDHPQDTPTDLILHGNPLQPENNPTPGGNTDVPSKEPTKEPTKEVTKAPTAEPTQGQGSVDIPTQEVTPTENVTDKPTPDTYDPETGHGAQEGGADVDIVDAEETPTPTAQATPTLTTVPTETPTEKVMNEAKKSNSVIWLVVLIGFVFVAIVVFAIKKKNEGED